MFIVIIPFILYVGYTIFLLNGPMLDPSYHSSLVLFVFLSIMLMIIYLVINSKLENKKNKYYEEYYCILLKDHIDFMNSVNNPQLFHTLSSLPVPSLSEIIDYPGIDFTRSDIVESIDAYDYTFNKLKKTK